MAPIWRQEEGPFGGTSEPEAGTKLYISNLDYDVTNEDIMVMILCGCLSVFFAGIILRYV